MADTLRCFFSLPLDRKTQSALAEIRRRWEPKLGRGVRWVPEGTHHITLRFLGHLNRKKLPAIQSGWPAALNQAETLIMDLNHWGCFPDLRRPRVVWLGAEAPPALWDLKHRLDQYLAQNGLPQDKDKFHPHITVARVKDPSLAPAVRDFLDQISDIIFPSVVFDRVCLMESRLTPQGPVYQCLNEWILPHPTDSNRP